MSLKLFSLGSLLLLHQPAATVTFIQHCHLPDEIMELNVAKAYSVYSSLHLHADYKLLKGKICALLVFIYLVAMRQNKSMCVAIIC